MLTLPAIATTTHAARFNLPLTMSLPGLPLFTSRPGAVDWVRPAHGFHPAYFQTDFVAEALPSVWPATFGIVTAWATTGEHWPEARNREADEHLRQTLQARGLPHQRLTGTSPDGTHAEPGWAVTATRAEVVALGREFLQDAVYWVESDQLQVLSCREDRAAPVGRFSERVRASGLAPANAMS